MGVTKHTHARIRASSSERPKKLPAVPVKSLVTNVKELRDAVLSLPRSSLVVLDCRRTSAARTPAPPTIHIQSCLPPSTDVREQGTRLAARSSSLRWPQGPEKCPVLKRKSFRWLRALEGSRAATRRPQVFRLRSLHCVKCVEKSGNSFNFACHAGLLISPARSALQIHEKRLGKHLAFGCTALRNTQPREAIVFHRKPRSNPLGQGNFIL